jgi:hypothetical protein
MFTDGGLDVFQPTSAALSAHGWTKPIAQSFKFN